MAVAGPHRSGSGLGFPVPSSTICVWLADPTVGGASAFTLVASMATDAIIAPRNVLTVLEWRISSSLRAASSFLALPHDRIDDVVSSRALGRRLQNEAVALELEQPPLTGTDVVGVRGALNVVCDDSGLLVDRVAPVVAEVAVERLAKLLGCRAQKVTGSKLLAVRRQEMHRHVPAGVIHQPAVWSRPVIERDPAVGTLSLVRNQAPAADQSGSDIGWFRGGHDQDERHHQRPARQLAHFVLLTFRTSGRSSRPSA